MLPLILGGISLAAQAWGAKKQADAAKKAGQQQAAAAGDARRAYDQSYQVQQGLLDPQAALGRQSMNTLGRLMQPGVGYSPDMQAQDAAAFQNAPSQWQAPPPQAMGRPAGPIPGGIMGRINQQQAMQNQPMAEPPPAFMPFARPGGPMMSAPSRIRPQQALRRAPRLGDLMPGRRA